MSLIFIAACASLFLQVSIHKIGFVKWFELYRSWCDWCFRFWNITTIMLLTQPITPELPLYIFAASFISHLIDKIEISYDN